MSRIAVVGAGAFGTALAICFARGGAQVTLYAKSHAAADVMRTTRTNAARLPGHTLPDTLIPTADPAALRDHAAVVMAVPAQITGTALGALAPYLAGMPLTLAAKGLSLSDGRTQTDLAAAAVPDAPLAVLSGPGFAGEIAAGLPTALTLAAEDGGLARELQDLLSTPSLRLYRHDDPLGVQLGGALKNVIALACGICIGAGLGESARAALMTRGFAEMTRLGTALGARADTFTGLSGLGDLALSAASDKSRNYAAGLQVGRGTVRDSATGGPSTTIEGLATARAVRHLAGRSGVDMPIAAATAAILDQTIGVRDALDALLARPLKQEG